jgi:hypothetical protein
MGIQVAPIIITSLHIPVFTVKMDVIRDSFVGQILRLATNNRILLYPEEKPGFRWEQLVRCT